MTRFKEPVWAVSNPGEQLPLAMNAGSRRGSFPVPLQTPYCGQSSIRTAYQSPGHRFIVEQIDAYIDDGGVTASRENRRRYVDIRDETALVLERPDLAGPIRDDRR